MNRLNNMTVKTSWSLVLLAFSVIILLIGGLSIYTSHQSRQSFETLNQTHVERAGALQRTYINLLQAQVAMDRAAELVRVPSFDEPGPVLDQAAAFIEQAQGQFETSCPSPAKGRPRRPWRRWRMPWPALRTWACGCNWCCSARVISPATAPGGRGSAA